MLTRVAQINLCRLSEVRLQTKQSSLLCRSCSRKCVRDVDDGRGGKTTSERPRRWEMESCELQCVAEVSNHHHIQRTLSTACSAAESTSHAAATTDDVLSDICH